MKINILIAYPYFKDDMIARLREMPRNSYRLIIDSGAFTCWNTGKIIHLSDYCRWLERVWKDLQPDHVVQLDVIGEPEPTWKNFLEMEKLGFNIMPVFTRGDDPGKLEEMYARTDYVMLGGIVMGEKNTGYCKWFDRVNKGRKAHWLGFNRTEDLKIYKPESVDSSSWSGAQRFGTFNIYAGHGKLKSMHRTDLTLENFRKYESIFRLSGFNCDDLIRLKDPKAWIWAGGIRDMDTQNKSFASFLGCVAHMRRAIDIEKNLNTKVYLAATTIGHIDVMFRSKQFLEERKAYY